MFLQIVALLIALAVSLAFLRRALPLALSNPCGFPTIRWRAPEIAATAGIVAFFLWSALSTIGQPPGKISIHSLGLSIFVYAAIVLLLVGILVFRSVPLRSAFGLGVGGWGPAVVGGWLLMCLPFVHLAQMLSYAISGAAQAPQDIVEFLIHSGDWPARSLVIVLAVVVAPVTEELIFRGCLYGILRGACGRTVGILISALLFAAIHGHVPSLGGLFLLAVGLALVYERCGSLWAPISMHAAFNAITIAAVILWPDLLK